MADEAEAEPEMVAVEATVEPEPVLAEAATEAAETFAMDERPIELVVADQTAIAEPDPDMTWDWDFVADTEAAPADMPEPLAEPIAAAAETAETAPPSEPEGRVDAPIVPAGPEALPPPVYRPLPPLGPILPPPPSPAGVSPRIEFDLLEPPPAFVIAAPQPAQALMRPTLPAGLFDGPAPQIRPCHQCELPVSAKARFCRRCGSAQN